MGEGRRRKREGEKRITSKKEILGLDLRSRQVKLKGEDKKNSVL